MFMKKMTSERISKFNLNFIFLVALVFNVFTSYNCLSSRQNSYLRSISIFISYKYIYLWAKLDKSVTKINESIFTSMMRTKLYLFAYTV